jgi:hypothetical protein
MSRNTHNPSALRIYYAMARIMDGSPALSD